MADTDTSSPASGGSRGNPNAKAVRVDLSAGNATLVAATHGGKPLKVRADVEGRSITLYSAVAGATNAKHKRLGITCENGSKPIAVYNAGTSNTDQILEAILLPGESYDFETTDTATAKGSWNVAGKTFRGPWARNEAATFDIGTTAFGTVTDYPPQHICWVSATCFVAVYTTTSTDDVMAVVGTIDASKTITLGSAQTIRATANVMRNPMIAQLDTTRVIIAWYDNTSPKPEMVVASVNESTRALSLGSVVDINATTTFDYTATLLGIVKDGGTAGAFWYHGTTASGIALAHATASGTTITLEAGNITTGFGSLLGTQLESPAADKCLTVTSDAGNKTSISRYSVAAGTITRDWATRNPDDTKNSTAMDGIIGLSATKLYAIFGSGAGLPTAQHTYEATVGASGITSWRKIGLVEPRDIAQLESNWENYEMEAADERTLIGVQQGVMVVVDLQRPVLAAPVNSPATNFQDNYYPLLGLPKMNAVSAYSGSFLAVQPTTRDIVVGQTKTQTQGGNKFIYFNVYEWPRN